MLSKSAAKTFFLVGTAISAGLFFYLTWDTFKRIPAQTHAEKLTAQVIRGKRLWDKNNCMGCHTLLGEGAYYAPELTRVYERRGAAFMTAILKDPEKVYPGQRRMQNYHFSDAEIADLVAFFQWVGGMDLNGFPPKPQLLPLAIASESGDGSKGLARREGRPLVFNQLCLACHQLGGQGGVVGPSLDGVGSRRDRDYLIRWLQDPAAMKADTKMPKLPLSESDISELAAFLTELKSPGKSP